MDRIINLTISKNSLSLTAPLKVTASAAHNRIPYAEFTVAQKLNQTSPPENGLFSFSGVLFWFFFAQAKKNIRKKLQSFTKLQNVTRPVILMNRSPQLINRQLPKSHNRIPPAEFTVAQSLNPTSPPENGLFSFSGALFSFFFGQAKKNNKIKLQQSFDWLATEEHFLHDLSRRIVGKQKRTDKLLLTKNNLK